MSGDIPPTVERELLSAINTLTDAVLSLTAVASDLQDEVRLLHHPPRGWQRMVDEFVEAVRRIPGSIRLVPHEEAARKD